MSRRRSIPDRSSVGRSKEIPFSPAEGHRRRHDRRLDKNLEHEAEVREWCKSQGFTLEVKNDGHHWIFTGAYVLIEWWPSTAKMVLNKRWHSGIHVHDWEQAIREIQRWLEGEKS